MEMIPWRFYCQPQVTGATVNLATETALVKVKSESMESSGWEKVKRQLAEALAKHLTTCGFKSTVRGGMLGCLRVPVF